MNAETKAGKRKRLMAAWEKLNELQQTDPAGDVTAHHRAAAMHLTTTFGLARPLSDRYVAQAAGLRKALYEGLTPPGSAEGIFLEDTLKQVSDLDDHFGASFMVIAHHVEEILKGGKHMSRRFRKWGDVGDIFRVKGKRFRFIRVEQMRVGDITDDDIRKEGYTSRQEFEEMWLKTHPKSVKAGKTLDPNGLCWCHEYEPVPMGSAGHLPSVNA